MGWGLTLLFGLAAIATSTPIAGEYLMAFCLLVWLATGGRWRLAWLGRHAPAPLSPADARLMAGYATAARPLHWGVAAYVGCHLASALVGSQLSDYAKPLPEALRGWSHVGLKLGVSWLVLASALLVATRLGLRPARIGRWLCLWLLVNLAYCVAQRYTGVDWTHGWHAVLGPHRFAYGVYRVSGFMGHPLTFAYNMMLVLLAALGLAWRQGDGLTPAERRGWWGVSAACALTLMISGSRFVLLVIVVVLALCEGRRLLQRWRWLLAGAAAAAAALWAEGSFLGRFAELFDEKTPLLTRFPRLVFWQVHWRMFADQPLAGVTLAGEGDALAHYYSAAGYHDNMYAAHNMVLQTLADTGLIGLLGLLAFFTGLVVCANRLRRWLGGPPGLSLLVLATALTGMMQNNLRDSEYLYALWFYLSLLLAHAAELGARRQLAESR